MKYLKKIFEATEKESNDIILTMDENIQDKL